MQIPLFLQTGLTVEEPPISLHYKQMGLKKIDNSYIPIILQKHFPAYQLISIYNLPSASLFLKDHRIDGLIIPHGHADISTLENMGLERKTLDFPVFKGYRFRLDSVGEEFKKWLNVNFKTR